MNIQQEIHKALECYQAGDLQQAKQICKRILKKQPQNAEVFYFLGVIYSHLKNHDLAVQFIKKSLHLSPNNPDAYHLVGMSYQAQGKLDEAIEYYRKTIEHNPNYAEAYNNLGNVFKERRQFEEAIECYKKVVELKPDLSIAYHNLGVMYQERKAYDDAITFYKKALDYDPSNLNTYRMLGTVFQNKGLHDGALECYQEAERMFREVVKAVPKDYSSYHSLGNVLQDQGKIDEAIACYRTALELNPNEADVYFSLGDALHEKGKTDEAIENYQKATEVNPGFADAYNNLGVLLEEKIRNDEAVHYFRKALSVDGNSYRALTNLGNILSEQGKGGEAEEYYRRALSIEPSLSSVNSNLLLAMNYNPRYDADMIFSEHLDYARKFASPLFSAPRTFINIRHGARRLRIGYVSPDFNRHSVPYFIGPVLAAHDRDRFEVFCYADLARQDDFTERIRGYADHWRKITHLPHEKVAELIVRDEIDILVDLAGHTARNRLPVFAQKPAPVQVSWIGYPATTGLPTVEYKIVDYYTDPPGMTERYYTEHLVRLPGCFLCYQPERDAPETSASPALTQGYVTFGSFNNYAKVSEEVLLLWAEILRAAPSARLLMKAKGLSSAGFRNTLLDFFGLQGIPAERIELCAWIPAVSGHLSLYNKVDIALDTFPYNGTTTTCEALYMGVPVITLSGKVHASRVGASLLSNVGLPDLIADNYSDYRRIALNMADDPGRLSFLRTHLREMMTQSTLTDARRFTDNLEKVYRDMWTEWCNK